MARWNWKGKRNPKYGSQRFGEKNPHWQGEEVGYRPLHAWIKKRLKKPKKCPSCGSLKNITLANISQEYKRDLSDWEWLCVKCHMAKYKREGSIKKKFPNHVYE
jgi:hypothetical protein